MSTQSLNCPNCGAPLSNPQAQTTVICDHCGSLVAIHAPPALPRPDEPAQRPAYGASGPDPVFQYGSTPVEQPERSALTSLTLGPEDARHIVELLRDHQQMTAIKFYHGKVDGSLGEAKAAVEAIEAGLRDASAPLPPASATSGPHDLNKVRSALADSNKIEAIQAYREATGLGLREAKEAVDGLERQLYPGRARQTVARPSASGSRGCVAIVLAIVTLIMCIFGGCGAYVQTQAIYKCSMREIKAAVVQQKILQPPVDGGYFVIVPGYQGRGGFNDWYVNAEYFAPVWGANGFGVVYAHIVADSNGWNNVSARLYKDGHTQVIVPGHTIECGS